VYSKPIIIGLFSFLMLFSFIPSSQAVLWEFVVELDIENGVVQSGDTVVVTGRVVDHAYEPTRGVEVLIRTGTDTTKAFTDTDGTFRGEFVDFQRVPGTYIVNVVASWYGMTGLASTEFQVKGDSSPVSILQQQLSTDQARKYLGSNESDFEKNPIGQTLFKYYHELHDKLIEEKKEANKPIAEQIFLEQQRRIAENLRNQAVEEYQPGFGTYGGYQYENYIAGLNPEIRDLVINQLAFTQNNFLDAQKIRAEILENGGTYEEARQAYLDRLTIPKEILEKFNETHLDDSEEVEESQTSEE
jgi:hypothetical protein